MQAKLTQLKWTSGGGGNRDLAFLIVFLVFGVIFLIKASPYFHTKEQNVIYNKVQTTPSVPKSFLAEFSLPLTAAGTQHTEKERAVSQPQTGEKRPSIVERPLFDGQAVILKVRSMNSYSSNDPAQPIEAQIISPVGKDTTEIDFAAAMGGKLIGTGSANLSEKSLNVSFNELLSADGRSYAIQGQAIGSGTLAPGINGDYSSGLPSRLAGIAIDRTILAADEIGTAYLFSAIGPAGANGQQLRTAAMEANQQGSQDISAEATKGLRDTPAKIELPAGSVFMVQIRAAQSGGHR